MGGQAEEEGEGWQVGGPTAQSAAHCRGGSVQGAQNRKAEEKAVEENDNESDLCRPVFYSYKSKVREIRETYWPPFQESARDTPGAQDDVLPRNHWSEEESERPDDDESRGHHQRYRH